jgi:glycosyltransferase involved in cell wall biosynthesis
VADSSSQARSNPAPRLIFEVGTILSARGHSDGITRTVRALLSYAMAHRPDVVFAAYDLQRDAFMPLRDNVLQDVLSGSRVDRSHIPDPFAERQRLRERLPAPLRELALLIQRPRRRAFLYTERIRLTSKSPPAWLARLQDWLLSDKYRKDLSDGRGGLRTLIPYDLAVGEPLRISPTDIALFVGSDFPVMYRVASRYGQPGIPRMVVLCHDIIPLMFPQFYKPHDVRRFGQCFHAILPTADLTVFTTHRVEADVRAYCAEKGLTVRRSAIAPLGADLEPLPPTLQGSLPYGLRKDGYVLFVSTIEPRKNHRLLVNVWRRLLGDGAPARRDFKLVFVGRPGWLVDKFMQQLRQEPSYGDSLLVLSDVNDADLHRIYSGAAFCALPSLYEGFGLPVIEAFRYGKAVITSTGGALPEVVQDFSPTLDPLDEDAWFMMMREWIDNPAARAGFERAIAERFKPRDWTAAGRDFFAAIDRELLQRSPGIRPVPARNPAPRPESG